MLGVVLDRDTMDLYDLDFSDLEATLPQWCFFANTAAGQRAERLAGATAAVSNKVMLDETALASATELRLICVAATGTNNVDLDAAVRRGITVCNVRGYSTPGVAQHVFTLVLALCTRLLDYHRDVQDAAWQRSELFCLLDHPISELAGKTLGIIGYGEIGRAVARLGEAFGMQVLIAQRAETQQPERVPLRLLLADSDVVTLHCPLTPETRGLIGADELALMKPDALLINTARGGIVDEVALAEALTRGQLGGAGVDVLSTEPPARGNPLLAPNIPNLIVTPHVAWASRQARQRLLTEIAHNVRAFLSGTPRNVVT